MELEYSDKNSKRSKLYIAVGLVIALIVGGVVFVALRFANLNESNAVQMRSVVVAVRDIASRKPIEDGDVTTRTVPSDPTNADAFTRVDEVLGRIETEHLTLEMAVAPVAMAMANHTRLEAYDLSSLRYIMWGATPVTENVAKVVTERTGVRWLPAYGASELPVIACNPVRAPEAWRLDSAGLPPAGVELRVADLDTGETLTPGQTGEIQVQSPSVMAGYLPEEATADAFADGWYRTGDVGWLEPEGWVHLTDRSKEMMKVNAFQVAPAEIEAVLLGHPAVLDCAVFGVPDERAGEVPATAVQLDPSWSVVEGELQRLVADSLATYKHLRHVVVVDAIPRLPSGKALRRTLREEWAPTLVAAEVPATADGDS